ncbi:hypothetical protein [Bradyrhizobium cenepequi]|uniref:hypothetical protein n=1 Tax=Bradyrhizobium cenepequi TaxID=2821403 RepID=UPI001CE2FDDD|nr:hypothetical protein [Bradyrhizobium cenepequi]MCA6111582.1 hypothetical protein [Bradyrhizobium cenepequi]
MTKSQKITFDEMRESGLRGVLIYCRDYKCSHHVAMPDDRDRWRDDLRISN